MARTSNNTFWCLLCTWLIVCLSGNIYWGIYYSEYKTSSSKLPDTVLAHRPPTLSHKKLVITKDTISYDNIRLNVSTIYFEQGKSRDETDSYYIWQPKPRAILVKGKKGVWQYLVDCGVRAFSNAIGAEEDQEWFTEDHKHDVGATKRCFWYIIPALGNWICGETKN